MADTTPAAPHASDTERAVLASLMQYKSTIAGALDIGLDAQDFYASAHRIIYRAILALFDKAVEVDIITLSDELRRGGVLESVGDTPYLSELGDAASGINIRAWVESLQQLTMRRRLITESHTIIADCRKDDYEGESLAEDAQNRIFAASTRKQQGRVQSAAEILPEVMRNITAYSQGVVQGVKTGFDAIDNLTGGLHCGDLIILAGRPSMGKTAMALGMALHAAQVDGKRCLFCSLEMSRQQVIERLLCMQAREDMRHVRSGRLSSGKMDGLYGAATVLTGTPLYIDDTPGVSVSQVRAKILRSTPEVVFVDYLQLMAEKRSESRQQEVSAISRGLKNLAREFDIPVVALSQLSRAVEMRKPPRPMLSDLRESGALEQDADVVMFVYRPERYSIVKDAFGSAMRRADIIIDKQRNGPTGTTFLTFLDWCARFEARTRDNSKTPEEKEASAPKQGNLWWTKD